MLHVTKADAASAQLARAVKKCCLLCFYLCSAIAFAQTRPATSPVPSLPRMDLSPKPLIPIPAHHGKDVESAAWWCDRAEAEARQISGEYDRAHLLYRLATLRARLGDLDAAIKLLNDAEALKQPPSVPKEWTSNEKLSAYAAITRLIATQKGTEPARQLLQRLSPDDLKLAEWMPAAALAAGRAEANDAAEATRIISACAGQDRDKAATYAIRIFADRQNFTTAEQILGLMKDQRLKDWEACRTGAVASGRGDFAAALRLLQTISRDKMDGLSLRGTLAGTMAYEAVKAGQMGVLERLQAAEPSEIVQMDAWLGILRGRIARNELDEAERFLDARPQRWQSQYAFLLAAAYSNQGEAEKARQLMAKQGERVTELQKVKELVNGGRLDEAIRVVNDNFANLDTRERSEMLLAVVNALVNQKRFDEAHALLNRHATDDTKLADLVERLEARIFWAEGNREKYTALLTKIQDEAVSRRRLPKEYASTSVFDLALQVGDFDTAWKAIAPSEASSRPSDAGRHELLGFYLSAALKTDAFDALKPAVPALERTDSGPASPLLNTLAMTYANTADQGTATLKLLPFLQTPRSRARLLLAMAQRCLPVDPTSQENVRPKDSSPAPAK